MKKRKYLIITVLAAMGLVMSFSSGCLVTTPPQQTQPEPTVQYTSGEGIDVIDEAWNIIFDEYVDKTKLDPERLKEAAIRGILEELNDPYSSYLSVQHYQSSMEGFEGKFEGIGAYVGMRDGKVTIIAPIPDSPAEKAGVRPGDVLVGIDGESAEGISVEEAVMRIRGPAGTPVTGKKRFLQI